MKFIFALVAIVIGCHSETDKLWQQYPATDLLTNLKMIFPRMGDQGGLDYTRIIINHMIEAQKRDRLSLISSLTESVTTINYIIQLFVNSHNTIKMLGGIITNLQPRRPEDLFPSIFIQIIQGYSMHVYYSLAPVPHPLSLGSKLLLNVFYEDQQESICHTELFTPFSEIYHADKLGISLIAFCTVRMHISYQIVRYSITAFASGIDGNVYTHALATSIWMCEFLCAQLCCPLSVQIYATYLSTLTSFHE